ncbi:flagellin FliC [bacterium]|nr:flagellin FliC [bacterium]
MALTINTNLSSLIVQSNLSKATSSLNNAIERMTTGYKINHAADNAAGYSIARNWETQLGSLDVAADNAATGADMMTTLEDTYSLVSSHLQRVRDLTEQAANGTYGSDSLKAIQSEITARLDEVDRIAANCEFNGLKMMDGSMGDINLQVGLYGSTDSQITLDASLFEKGDIKSLFGEEKADVAEKCAGLKKGTAASSMLDKIDKVINEISGRVTTLGAAQNRIESAVESIGVQTENITSSLSTLRDADVAEESSNYIKAQILQQASATLLATANQTPSIALNLL